MTPNTPPVWFSGIPFAHGNNPLLVPILNAPAESFASDTESDASSDVVFDYAERGGEGLWAGSSLGIVTGFQTRDSARITWVGGVELFSDEYANKPLPSYVKLVLTAPRLNPDSFAEATNPETRSSRTISQPGRSKRSLCSVSTAQRITS